MTIYSFGVGGRWAGKRRCSHPLPLAVRKGWNVKTQRHKKTLKSQFLSWLPLALMSKFAATSAKLHIVHTHGHLLVMLLEVFAAYVLASTSSSVALMATLMRKYPKILHSYV